LVPFKIPSKFSLRVPKGFNFPKFPGIPWFSLIGGAWLVVFPLGLNFALKNFLILFIPKSIEKLLPKAIFQILALKLEN